MADSDGQVVIDLSLRRDGIQSDIEWLESNLKNLGANVNADGISEKFENAMDKAKSSVEDTMSDINNDKAEPKIGADDSEFKEKTSESDERIKDTDSKKANPKIGADDSELDEKVEESKSKLTSVNSKRATAKLKADAEDLLEKAEKGKSALRRIPKSVRTEIIAQAKNAGIENFEKLLNRLPKQAKTELIADVRDGKLINFEEALNKVPKEKLTTLEVNDKASAPLKRMTASVDESDTKTKSFTESLKGTAVGMGIYQTAMMAGQAVTAKMGDAINRVDTLNNSKRVFQNMGYSAQDTKKAMDSLNQSINGLPTPLDKAVQGVQMVAATTNNLGQAQKVWSALNDAVIGFGGTTDQVNEATIQLSQAFSNGKIDGQTWISMMNDGMGPALNAIAKQMGKTTGQLKDGLSGGKISVQAFQNALIQLDTKGGGSLKSLHQIAKDSTSGIKTSIANAGTAVTRGLGNVVTSFSNMLKTITGKNLSEIIQNMGKRTENALNSMSKAFTTAGEKIKPFVNAIKPLAKSLSPLAPMIKTFAGALIGLKVSEAAISGIAKLAVGMKSLVGVIGKKNIVIAGILAIGTAFVQLYQHNAKFKTFVDGIVKNISTLIKNITKVAKSLTKDFVGAFNKLAAPVKKTFSDIMKYIGPDLKTIQKNISSAMKTIQKVWNTAWKALQKVVTPIFNTISKFVSQHMAKIKNVINSVTKIISTIWKTIWKQVENVFKLVWDSIFHKSRVINDIKNIINTNLKFIQSIWKNVWNIIKNVFSTIWDAIKDIAKSAINWVKNIISDALKIIQSIWNKIWNAISDFVDNIWDGIKKLVSDAINAVQSTISNILDKIGDVWHSMWTSFSDFFKGIWKDIKQAASDGINGVLNVINAGIDGIDAVWKFFTGHETSIHHLKPVHFSQGGIVDRHLSMVNDGDGEDWKELIETPDGNLMMSNERNAVLPLEPGTRVYNGTETRQIMSMLGVDHYANGGVVGGIQHYKDGGVVGDVINWGAHELKDFGSWIKDKWDAITKFLKHPLENTKAIISKAITGPLSKLSNSNMVDLGKGVFDKLTKPISDWFKKGLEEAKKKHDEDVEYGKGYFNGGAGVARWGKVIDKAAKEMGVSLSGDQKARLLRQIATESGGNERIKQQISDVNSASGHPAQGLLQFIPSTFAHWAMPGHNNILSGYDQIMAAINCLNHGGEGGWGNIGNGHGWDNGGQVDQKQLAWIAENNREYVINPQRDSADELLRKAAEERYAFNPNSEVAKAIAGMNVARANNGSVLPNNTHLSSVSTQSGTNTPESVQNGNNVNIAVELDGRTIANASYPFQKALQANEIRMQTRKGGGVFA